MTVQSTRQTLLQYSGDMTASEVIEAGINNDSPGSIEIKNLASGANTITLPTGGTTVVACTILPPDTNTIAITLKGLTGDTGIRIHDTDPTTIAIDDSVTSFVLTAASAIMGVRLFWS